MSERKIISEFICPPIPVREFDWAAHFDDYEPGAPTGHGRTEQEAIRDLRINADLCEHCGSDLAPHDGLSCSRCEVEGAPANPPTKDHPQC